MKKLIYFLLLMMIGSFVDSIGANIREINSLRQPIGMNTTGYYPCIMKERSDVLSKKSQVTSELQDENIDKIKVTCVFPDEDYPEFIICNSDFFENSRFSSWEGYEDSDRYSFFVPAGVYDISTHFFTADETFVGFAYIIHEDINIHEDIVVYFSRDEATEQVSLRPLLRNGEEAVFPVQKFLDEEPWYELDYTASNSLYWFCNWALAIDGKVVVARGNHITDHCTEDQNADLSILINKVSDKYHFLACSFLMNKQKEFEISSTDLTRLGSDLFYTYNKDFIRYPVPDFVETPLYKEEGVIENHTSVLGCWWLDNEEMGGGGLYTPELKPDVYVTSQPNSIDMKTIVRTSSVQMERIEEYEEEEDGEIEIWTEEVIGEIWALPAWYNDNQWNYINQNHSECENFIYQIPLEGPIVEYPGVKPYCFTSEEVNEPFGNSCPILVPMSYYRHEEDCKIINVSPQAWIGRYGEVRNCDFWMDWARIEDKDGTVLFESPEGSSLYQWTQSYYTTPHNEDYLKYTFGDENILVDGSITGQNITSIEIDETNEDCCAPTPQMLIFKNTSGAITDRFDSASDGVIEFSAGDFNYYENEERYGYTVDEAEVLVEYAPYGDETWQPIEVEEVPEYFYMPGFGYFYRGSLGCVDQPSSNGWYDLRMTLTDKAGNRTVEHISPAFKIGEGSGVKSTPVGGVNVWVADGQLRTNCPEVASIEVFTLDGRLIAKTGGSSLSSLSVDGLTGALLVRLTTPSGTVSTHKLLL